jgi:hypothetical protein
MCGSRRREKLHRVNETPIQAKETTQMNLTIKRKLGLAAATTAMACFALTGTALAGGDSASVTTSTDSLNFGGQTVGTTSAAKPVTLSVPCLFVLDLGKYGGRSCSAPGKIEAAATSGDFDQTNDCVLPISNSSTSGEVVTCTLFVSFHPTASGERTGELSFTSYGSDGAYPVDLAGTGVALPVDKPADKPGEKGGQTGKGTQGSSGTAGAVAKKCKVKRGASKSKKKCKKKKRR